MGDPPLDLAHGVAMLQSGQYQDAISWFADVIASNQACIEAYSPMAIALIRTGDAKRAESILRQALNIKPDAEDCVLNLAQFYRDHGKPDAAIQELEFHWLRFPQMERVVRKLIQWCQDSGQTLRAGQFLEQALSHHPRSSALQLKQAELLMLNHEYSRAEEILDNILESKPKHAKCRLQLAYLYKLRRQYQQSESILHQLLTEFPDRTEVHEALGLLYLGQGRFKESISVLDDLCSRDALLESARANLGLAQLATGDFDNGWKNYECRKSRKQLQSKFRQLQEWQGPEHTVDSLLIIAEQGIGDEVMFSCVLDQVVQEVENCTLYCDDRLVATMHRSFPNLAVTGKASPLPNYEYDACISLPSLMQFYRQSVSDFKSAGNYLRADKELVRQWHERIKVVPEGVRIGFSWSGGKDEETRCSRSIPLEEWMPLFKLPDVQFVNLQYGDMAARAGEFAARERVPVHSFSELDPVNDLEQMFALMSNLDLVISIDNSTIHFAGALGCESLLLLPNNRDWRWVSNDGKTLWYPSVVLEQQNTENNWQGAIAMAGKYIQKYRLNRI